MLHAKLRRITLCMLALSLALLAAPAWAAGQWQTFLKTYTCNDLVAGADTVWIATGEAGLVRYLRSEDRFESSTREPGGLASNHITTMAFDRSGRVWCGTPGLGLSRLSADRSSWDLINAFDGLPSDTVSVLRADGDTMWIGTPRGIALWNGREIAGRIPDSGAPSPFADDRVTGIVVYGDSLFVATQGGVAIARISEQLANWTTVNTGLLTHKCDGMVTDGREIFVLAGAATYRWDRNAHVWGLAAGNGATKRVRDDFGRMLSISSSGTFEWITNQWAQVGGAPVSDGTDDGGSEVTVDAANHAFAFSGGALWEQNFVTAWPRRFPPAPAGNSVQNILADGSRVYVCTFGEGVSRFDGTQWRNWLPVSASVLQDTTFINPSYAFALQRDRRGRKWVTNWDFAVERFDDSVVPPHFDHLVVSPGSSDPLSLYTLGWSSCVDSSGYVFIGADTPDRGGRPPVGIAVYDTAGALIATYKTTNSGIPDNQVRALAVQVSASGTALWAGFPGTGVAVAQLADDHLAHSGMFSVVPATSNLDVFGIVARGDSIWVLTTSNLLRLRGTTRSVQSSLPLAAGPAPRGAVHPLAVGPDGSVYVGSVDGVRVFSPGKPFVDFKADNSPLADNEVRAISVDPVSGVVWIGTAAGMNRYDPNYTPPPAPRPAALRIKIYPNPVTQTGIGFELRLSGNTTAYQGEILDLNGRVLRRFIADANDRVVWDGYDSNGERVRPGIYFVHAHGGGREGTARVVVLH
jgi:hypothetical protein